jgi:hypothetical protein
MQGMMNPWLNMAQNPWSLYLMNQGNAGTNYKQAPTMSDQYNFMGNMLKGAVTPGTTTPAFGQVLGNLAAALSNPNSPVYAGIFGDTLDASGGMDSPGSVLRNMTEALSGFGLTMNPLASQMLQKAMGLFSNDYMNMLNVNNPDSQINPAAYLLSRLGITGANVPNPTAANLAYLNPGASTGAGGGGQGLGLYS